MAALMDCDTSAISEAMAELKANIRRIRPADTRALRSLIETNAAIVTYRDPEGVYRSEPTYQLLELIARVVRQEER